MTNRLAGETSPYLLQHKDNPVDWYPWGPEALNKAKEEDKLILLSIGYSACHWCHVMEHESFEDERTAGIMNDLYVSIKVDREERPDLDNIYMQAVQAMTGQGGWPMTVFMTSDGRPVYGGTYFPPHDGQGRPSFTRVLQAVADAYRTDRDKLMENSNELIERMKAAPASKGTELLTEEILGQAGQQIQGQFDPQHGGFGGAPKFPQPMAVEALLRLTKRFEDPEALRMVEFTLEKMAWGGMYDHLGGGFHRYSTDAHWLVPHFEKMLYDNAQLSLAYLHAYQATGRLLYRRVAEETFDYVLREMTDSTGGFYSTQDADSEGVEGKFFVWTPEEIVSVLGEAEGEVFNRYYGVTQGGNFEGGNILNVPAEPATVAEGLGSTEEELEARLLKARKILYRVREQRVHPGLDDKMLTSWNGLMLRSLAEGAAVLGRADYISAAEANASFLLEHLRDGGRLLRTYRDGEAKLPGFLEDYAMLADGLVALYEATFERRWLDEAKGLADAMIDLFWDASEEAFYDTARDHEALIVRPRDIFDNAMPCGGSAAADILLRLGILTGQEEYARTAAASLRSVASFLTQYPVGMGRWIGALEFYLSTPYELVVVGSRDDQAARALLDVVFGFYLPNKVVAGWDPAVGPLAAQGLPLLQDRPLVEGRPTAYVCQNYTCKLPVTEPKALAEQLGLRSA